MAAKKTITIVGVTGTQGRAVAKTFLEAPDWHVRGLTRSTESSAAHNVASKGVELVQGNLDDKASLVEAFRGSDAIYANTDFWALTKDSKLQTLLATTYAGLPLNQACMKHEFQQGKNIIEAAAEVLATESQLDSFVLSTLSHASKWSNGEVTSVLHFDVKALIEAHLKENFPALAAKSRYLQVGFYMSNIINPFLLPRKGDEGAYEWHIPYVTPSTILSATCPEQDTGVFVRALMSAPAGTTLLGESDPVTVEEFLVTWSAVTGHPSKLITGSSQQVEAAIEAAMPSFGKELGENFLYYRDYSYTGKDPNVKRPVDLNVEKDRLTTFKQYLGAVDWDSLLQI